MDQTIATPRSPSWRRVRLLPLLAGILVIVGLVGFQHLRARPSYPDYLGLVRHYDPAVERGRVLEVDGVINFRDIGGYHTVSGERVRQGMLYRSGDLSALTEDGAAVLAEIGLRTVYDLRTSPEIVNRPNRIPPGASVIHLPIHEDDEQAISFMQAISRHNLQKQWIDYNVFVLAEEKAERYGRLFEALADDVVEPALLLCTAGKDRTGIGSALFLLMLGVPEEAVIADYTMSNVHFPEILGYAQSRYDQHRFFTRLLNMDAIDLHIFHLARAETMEVMIRHLTAEYGSIENYLIDRAGLDLETIEALRHKYLLPTQ